MKIGEYIELVKQADFTDGNSQWEAATKAPAEAPPVGEPVNIDPVQTGAKSIPSSEAGYPPQIKSNNLPKEPWFRMSFEHPDGSKGLEMHIRPRYKLEEVPRFGEGRSWWQYGKDWFNPQKYYEWAKHQWNNKGKNFRNFWKGTYNAPGNQFNALNSNVRHYEFSPLTIGFSVLGPMHEALETIQENATDKAFKDGYVPKDNIPLPLGYTVSPDWKYTLKYYYPELGRELVRETPNIITELLSFNNPTAPLNFAGDIFINPISQALTGKDAVPGLYRPAFSQNRAKSPEEWEALKTRAAANNRKYIVDDILKLNNDAYGYGNWMVDNLAALADPAAQTGGWLIDLAADTPNPIPRIAKHLMGNPKSTYEHNMSSLAKVMDKELQTNVDKYGNKTTDWQALLDFIPGVKSWYDLNGGRPEFRNVPIEQRREMVKPLIEGAIRNGYTKDEIEDAIDLYIDDNSRLYTGANKLQLMAMSPHDIYGQKLLLRNIDTVPKDKYGKPLPRYYQAPPANPTFGPSFNHSEKPRYYNNPEWVSANFEIQRMLDDQNTLFKLNPFFKGLVGSQDQLSDEERELLSDPNGLREIQEAKVPQIDHPEWNTIDNKEQLRTYWYKKISQMPVRDRYVYLLSNPYLIEKFLDKFYTNEGTRNKIRKFLFPDSLTPQELEQITPVAKPVGTLTSILAPSLLKARQQTRVQQQINDAM